MANLLSAELAQKEVKVSVWIFTVNTESCCEVKQNKKF